MSLDFTDDKSTLVQVMAWCCQATSHYLSQCWPRSLSTYGITKPQWVKLSIWYTTFELYPAGLGSNTFYQIQIQIQIQKFGFFKYKYKYFVQLWFKYKYKYIDSNTNTNTFNQIYLPKLFRPKIVQFHKSQDTCLWAVLPLGDTWSLTFCISRGGGWWYSIVG